MNWKNSWLLAISSGLLAALSWPSYGFSAALFIAFVPLLFLADTMKADNRRAGTYFRMAFLAFFIWNSITTYWIYNASAFGMAVAILLNSGMMSTIFWVYYRLHNKLDKTLNQLLLVSLWISMEWFHHQWDFSFPWMSLGNVFAQNITWIQWYEYTGIFGGSLWVLLTNLAIYSLFFASTKLTKARIASTISVIVFPILFSHLIFANYKEDLKPCPIVVVQPNVDPYTEKFTRLPASIQVNRLVHLSDSLGQKNTEFFIWPETAFPFSIAEELLEEDPLIIQSRNFLARFKNGNIITGASTYKTYATAETITARKFRSGECCYDAFNSALLIENNPGVKVYHKSKLVTGVEQMPYPKYMKFLEPLALNLGGSVGSLGKQDQRTVLYSASGIGAAPVICYESVYGEYVTDYVKNGAQFIAIITNDGWWGNTEGHRQHAAYASLRAIENRRSIARSANTGISCFINQRGEVMMRSNYGEATALSSEINLNDELTFYTKHGDYIAKIAGYLCIFILAFALYKTSLWKRTKHQK